MNDVVARPPTSLDSAIVSATVYSAAAHVCRRAAALIEPGVWRLALEGLPAGLDPGMVRVATTRGVLRAVESETSTVARDPYSEAVALEATVETLEARARQVRGELEGLSAELALIDRLAPHSAGMVSASAPLRPEVFLRGLDFVAQRRRETQEAIRRVGRELARVEAELKTASRRRALVGQTAGAERQRSVLVVVLDADSAGDCAIEVTYEAAWATWRPYYHLRLDGRAGTIECVRYADVWQETGEDWSSVRLRLSTAEPEAGLHLPVVTPWTLGLARSFEDQATVLYQRRARQAPVAPSRFKDALEERPRSMDVVDELGVAGFVGENDPFEDTGPVGETNPGLDAASADEFRSYAKQFEDEGAYAQVTSAGIMKSREDRIFPTTIDHGSPGDLEDEDRSIAPSGPAGRVRGRRTVRGPSAQHPDLERLHQTGLPRELSGGIDHELEVAGRASCASGLERRRMSLGATTYPARIEYLLRPAVREHAYARATVLNEGGIPFLGGPAAIFVGDAFFGETRIATTPAGGKLVLDLGAETSIRCARRTRTSIRTAGIITKEDIHEVSVVLEIESHLGEVAELDVQDQIPISKDANVKVRLVRLSPKDAKLDELTGLITFKVAVQPRSRLELAFDYQIEVPRDYQLAQLLEEV